MKTSKRKEAVESMPVFVEGYEFQSLAVMRLTPLETLTSEVKEANAALLQTDLEHNAAIEDEKVKRKAYEDARDRKAKAEMALLAFARGEVT